MVLLLHLDSCTCSLWSLCPLPALPPLLTLLSPPPHSGRLAPGSSRGEEGENFLSSPLFLFQHTKKGQRPPSHLHPTHFSVRSLALGLPHIQLTGAA